MADAVASQAIDCAAREYKGSNLLKRTPGFSLKRRQVGQQDAPARADTPRARASLSRADPYGKAMRGTLDASQPEGEGRSAESGLSFLSIR